MSEMFSYGWSIFVAVVTTVSLAWCLWLLLVACKRREMAKDNTTGHVWDVDLRELNNPLPRWWFWLFVITVVFGAFYLVLYLPKSFVSAVQNLGLNELRQLISEYLHQDMVITEIDLAPNEGAFRAALYALKSVEKETHLEEGGWQLIC